jgi:hypothetical protein
MNNGVHWASDYPLAIALGYSFGKIIQARGHTVYDRKTGSVIPADSGMTTSLNVHPAILDGYGMGITLRCEF